MNCRQQKQLDKTQVDKTYVVVGFKVNRRKSVYYKVCPNEDELSKAVVEAFTKRNADFISVRKVVD